MANPALLLSGSPDGGVTKLVVKTDAYGQPKVVTADATAELVKLVAKDYATQTTLAALLGKLADPATETTLQALLSAASAVTSVKNTTHHLNQAEAGTGTEVDVSAYEYVTFEVTGPFDGLSVTFKASIDGTNFWPLYVMPEVGGSKVSSVNTGGLYWAEIPGYAYINTEITGTPGATSSVTVKSLAIAPSRTGAATINMSDKEDRKLGQVLISGAFDTIRPMTGATKTATSIASEVFAGMSRKANRRGLSIKGEHPYLRLRTDGVGVTDTTGIALEPFAQAIFVFDPAVDVPVYVISEAGIVRYGVVEW